MEDCYCNLTQNKSNPVNDTLVKKLLGFVFIDIRGHSFYVNISKKYKAQFQRSVNSYDLSMQCLFENMHFRRAILKVTIIDIQQLLIKP